MGGLSILLHNKQFVSQEHPSCSCCWLHRCSLGNVLASIVQEVVGSQDAPKGPKGEVRGWIVRHDKELHPPPPPHPCTDLLKNKKVKIASFSPSLVTPSFIQIPVIIKSFRKWNRDNAPTDYFILNILIAFSAFFMCRALFPACVLCISLLGDLVHKLTIQKWEIQSKQLTEGKAYH